MSYTESQTWAWDILTPKERSALSLVVVNQRSKKEAAIILGISQYKFTEIYLRAYRLFIAFTEFHERNGGFMRSDLPVSKEDLAFIETLVLTRKTITDLVFKEKKYINLVSSANRAQFWQTNLASLKLSSSGYSKSLLEVLVTYDTWNRFRILPKPFQKISPFARRRNRAYKQIKDYVENVSEISWLIFERDFAPKRVGCFLPKLQQGYEPGTLEVNLSQKTLKYFTKNHLPVFKTEKGAKDLAFRIHYYNALSQKNSYSARKFWVAFRVGIGTAINFKELLGIIPGDLLDLPAKDKEFIRKAKKQQKPKRLQQIQRTRDDQFYI